MSANNPPNPYFNGINFNSSFFSTIVTYLTQAIADSRYLRLIGGTLSGFLGINRAPRVALDITGSAIINNGVDGVPINGTFGNNKLTLTEGNIGAVPIGFSTNSNVLQYSAQTNHDFYSGTTRIMNLNSNGYLGLNNASVLNGVITSYSTTSTIPRITLTGTEFISPYNNSTDGIALILGVNRTNNRQMYMADTSLLAVNTTNPTIRYSIGPTCGIDALATDGATRLNMAIGPNMTVLSNGNIGIGTNNTAAALDIAPMNYTLMRNGGSTYGISNQLLLSWNGNSNLNSHYHAINTRHSITTNYLNSIDFFIWQVGSATNQINTTQATLSITQPSVFVNVPSAYNYNSQGYGQSLTISGTGTGTWGQMYIYDSTASGTNYIGMLYKADSNLNMCSINTGRQGGGTLVPLYLNNISTAPIILGGPLYLGGITTTNLLNWDMNIVQNSANTLAGNINITAYGANGGINLIANGSTKLHIDPNGYVGLAGMVSTTQSTIVPTVTGTSGYWLIPIPLVVAGNYYDMIMLSVYNSDNTTWWSGNVVVNTIANTAAYYTVATGGPIQFNGTLVLNGSIWCIKFGFSNAFNITSGMLLYFKYIG